MVFTAKRALARQYNQRLRLNNHNYASNKRYVRSGSCVPMAELRFHQDLLLSSFRKPNKAGAIHTRILEQRELRLRGPKRSKRRGWGLNYCEVPALAGTGAASPGHLAARVSFFI